MKLCYVQIASSCEAGINASCRSSTATLFASIAWGRETAYVDQYVNKKVCAAD